MRIGSTDGIEERMLGSSRTTRPAPDSSPAEDEDRFALRVPSISLPKGGGALRGLGEKFAANPFTGTGAVTVQIPTSPGRAGFGPALELTYDSGAGDGPFGIGWHLTLPAITLRTDRGRPRYAGDDADVPVLAGAEDLIPILVEDASGNWGFEQLPPRVVGGTRYLIRRYRPRVEGTFAWIERWTNERDRADTFWRTISRENVTTWFGRTAESRIADPDDTARIFSWLPCETYDDTGNVAVYRYRADDASGVDVALASERNRTTAARETNRYLKRILYGNRVPYLPGLAANAPWPAPAGATADDASADWYFEVILDYGEHDDAAPTPIDGGAWSIRPDPFSTYRSGFEVRTSRLCRRVLMFHHFEGEPGVRSNCLVRSTTFAYSTDTPLTDASVPRHSKLRSVTVSGHVRRDDGYLSRSLPPLEFDYSEASTDDMIRELDAATVADLPAGIDGTRYQWVDLDGEGVSGVLTDQDGAWFYKRNLSPAPPAPGTISRLARLAPAERVATIPSRSELRAGQRLLDLAGDGQLDVVALEGPAPGFFERGEIDGWESFRPFRSFPNLPWRDPDVRLVDLTGDGLADVLVTADEGFTWYPALGEDGFGPPEATARAIDEERGPRMLATTEREAVYLTDMSGDGGSDIVRIRNAEICYWPNLGYGRFGAKVTMDRSPAFDEPDQFDPARLRLADVDGSGTTDLVYLGRSGVDVYANESGNGWTQARRLTQFPKIDDLSSVSAVDLLGNGTTCLVWSSPLPRDRPAPVRYIDLVGGLKPHLLVHTRNNLGAETTIDYAPSTKFYVADRLAGRPWLTRLPFPVHVVERVTARDQWRKTAFTSTYSYHHGYFDGVEREFRGFGRVEQVDVEDFDTFAAANVASPYVTSDRRLYQPPVKTVTWFETGSCTHRQRVLERLRAEFFPASVASGPAAKQLAGGFAERSLPELDLDTARMSAEEWREALRACRGTAVRQEVYELDVDALHERRQQAPVRLLSAASRRARIERLQAKAANRHAVFLVTEAEAISYQYDLDLRPATLRPDPRVSHTLNLRTDELGNVRQAVEVGYPRRGRYGDANLTAAQLATIRSVQAELHVGYAETRHTTDVVPASADLDSHRLRVPYDVRSYELTGIRPTAVDGYFGVDDLRAYLLSGELQPPTPPDPLAGYRPVGELAYHEVAAGTAPEKRLVDHIRTIFFGDDLQTPLPLGQQGRLGLTFEAYKLALTDALLNAIFGSKLADVVDGTDTARDKLDDASVSGYLSGAAQASRFAPVPAAELAGQYWLRSGTAGFAADAAQHFYLPERYTDAFGNVTELRFDARDLFVERTTDPVGNTMSIETFDWRVLAARRLKDVNDNLSEAVFDALGLVVAVAVMGKGSEADDLTGFTVDAANPDPRTVAAFCASATMDEATARAWLRRASRRFVYHFGEARDANGVVTAWAARPAAACSIRREVHAAAVGGATTPLQVSLECSDGSGGVLMQKAQAEPDTAGGPLRWIVAGKTVVNNKGKPVKQYEPYFSSSFGCEAVDERGATPLLYYDAADRLVRTEFPDGSFSRVEFSPWHVAAYDQNDTVLEPGNEWYARNTAPNASAEQQRAAAAAAAHAGTPSVTLPDALGRDVVGIEHNRYADENGAQRNEWFVTLTRLDVEGKPLWIRDPRRNLPVQYITPPMAEGRPADVMSGYVTCYDVAGNLLFQHSMDSGDRWMLPDATREPIVIWDVNERRSAAGQVVQEKRTFYNRYDVLRRPVERWFAQDGGARRLVEKLVPGETVAGATSRNLRGRLYRHHDPSGMTQFDRFDFKGNEREASRRLCLDYRDSAIDWQTNPEGQLEPDTFFQAMQYDALDRPTRRFAWHLGTGAHVAVHLPRYNERGALVSHDLIPHATKTASGFSTAVGYPRTTTVKNIVYNARGEIEAIEYGNGTLTRYAYDSETFRLVQLRTTRSGFDPPFPSTPTAAPDARILQNLFYMYDAMGNITEVRDAAFSPAFFRNQQVDPISRYRYDSRYRLIEATGRENYDSTAAPRRVEPAPFVVQFPVTDPTALRNYTERYEYDACGNIVSVRHSAALGSWTRHYEYATTRNRLERTWQGSNVGAATAYRHDGHGNILNVANTPPVADLTWDYRDALKSVDLQGGGRAHYVYDVDKRRTRKVIDSPGGAKRWERIYLDDVEIYRRYGPAGVVSDEIESHSILVEERRILLHDDVVKTTAPGLPIGILSRFQYSNHLGSACLELDASSRVISYEEFHPYGTSAYQAQGAAVEATPRRHRHTACERDTETGFDYHGVRFYLPWLGRWLNCDPAGLADGLNVYQMARSNPISYTDPEGRASGKEEKTVKPLIRGGLSNAPFIEEVVFRIRDPVTNDIVARGRFDFAVGPKNEFMSFAVFVEAKGGPGSPKTDPQEVYLPLFEKGVEVEIVSRKGSAIGLIPGQKVFVKTGQNFLLIHGETVGEFVMGSKAVYGSQPGILKQYGNKTWFEPAESAEKLQEQLKLSAPQKQGQTTTVAVKPPAPSAVEELAAQANKPASTLGQRLSSPAGRQATGNAAVLIAGAVVALGGSASAATAKRESVEALKRQAPEIEKYLVDNPTKGVLLVSTFRSGTLPESYTYTEFVGHYPLKGFETEEAARSYYENAPRMSRQLQAWTRETERREYTWVPPLATRMIPVNPAR
jgi:RHS repeat-associated protein